MKTYAFGSVLKIALFALFLVGAATGRGVAAAYVPAETTVLLLPAQDTTRDATNMLRPRQAVIRHRLQVEFIGRQFRVMGEALAQPVAMQAPAIDLATPSTRAAEDFDELGRRAGADWVVRAVVQSAEANARGEGFAVDTTLLMQVRDVRQKRWLIDRPATAQVDATGAPPLLFLRSLDSAVREGLRELLAPAPVLVRLPAEEGLVDYLKGQTSPVTADPAVPFAALVAGE